MSNLSDFSQVLFDFGNVRPPKAQPSEELAAQSVTNPAITKLHTKLADVKRDGDSPSETLATMKDVCNREIVPNGIPTTLSAVNQVIANYPSVRSLMGVLQRKGQKIGLDDIRVTDDVLSKEDASRLFDALIVAMIVGAPPELIATLQLALKANHLLSNREKMAKETVGLYARATVFLPSDIFPLPHEIASPIAVTPDTSNDTATEEALLATLQTTLNALDEIAEDKAEAQYVVQVECRRAADCRTKYGGHSDKHRRLGDPIRRSTRYIG